MDPDIENDAEAREERRDALEVPADERTAEEKIAVEGEAVAAPAVTTAVEDGAVPNQPVTEQEVCGICNDKIVAGDEATTETVYREGVADRRLVHIKCQQERAAEDRVGDPDAEPVEETELSDEERAEKDAEVARKEATQDEIDNNPTFRENQGAAE